MQIVEFLGGSLRFVDKVSDALPSPTPQDIGGVGFVWIFLNRSELAAQLFMLQTAARQLGGSEILDLHVQDMALASHPSHYDYTSVYDVLVFRRLTTGLEPVLEGEDPPLSHVPAPALKSAGGVLPAFQAIGTRAVAFAIFDRLLISVHPDGCLSARSFLERFLGDAQFSVGAQQDAANARSRLPTSPSDMALRMINAMVDSYLDLRKDLSRQLDHWQTQLLNPRSRFNDWKALLAARSQLTTLEDLCEEQHDAMQEWLDSLREQPFSANAISYSAVQSDLSPIQLPTDQRERDTLIARARDIIEHIERVVHHVQRLEQSAETVIQIHFSAQSHRTNDIMRTLTALTAVFLPLNLITGFFGMNFDSLPLIHASYGVWVAVAIMAAVGMTLIAIFWRKRYLARTQR